MEEKKEEHKSVPITGMSMVTYLRMYAVYKIMKKTHPQVDFDRIDAIISKCIDGKELSGEQFEKSRKEISDIIGSGMTMAQDDFEGEDSVVEEFDPEEQNRNDEASTITSWHDIAKDDPDLLLYLRQCDMDEEKERYIVHGGAPTFREYMLTNYKKYLEEKEKDLEKYK